MPPKSQAKSNDASNPMDFFPFRGQYGDTTTGGLLFVAVRGLLTALSYSLLMEPASRISFFYWLPGLLPSQSPPSDRYFASWILPLGAQQSLERYLGLAPAASIIFLGFLLPSISFTFYILLWRRERLPLKGQGGSIQITTNTNFLDILHPILFLYSTSDPSWSPGLLSYCIAPYIIGWLLHITVDHTKYLYKRNPKNDGRLMTTGPWSLVRHPNYLGFTVWRVAYSTAAGGWYFGAFVLASFLYLKIGTAIPIIEEYMQTKYKSQWSAYTKRVPFRYIPGVW